MNGIKSRKVQCYIYLCLAVIAQLELKNILFDKVVFPQDVSVWLIKKLFVLIWAIIVAITLYAVGNSEITGGVKQIMKRNIWGWIILVSSIIAFAVLMLCVCELPVDTFDKVRIVLSSAVIYFPNLLAIIFILNSRKTGTGMREP